MEIREIRPHSTYIGNGGITKKIKSICMATDGVHYVEWRLVGAGRDERGAQNFGLEPLENFAQWAKALKDTMSADLQHYLPNQRCESINEDLRMTTTTRF